LGSLEALQFAPHLKNVLSRVLPVLGGVKDIHKKIFAEGECQQQIDFSRNSCVGALCVDSSLIKGSSIRVLEENVNC